MTYPQRLRGQAPRTPGQKHPVDDWVRLRRFLVLGTEGGSFYAGEAELTAGAAQAVARCIAADGARVVAETAAISQAGRAPKNDPALFVLAMAAGAEDVATRRAALDALPAVARTGTHLLMFASFVEGFRGWGRGLRRAVGGWYAAQDADRLALQAIKYRTRGGISHRDVLRLAHPARAVSARNPAQAVSDQHARLFEWIVRGGSVDGLPRIVEGFVRVQRARDAAEAASLIRAYRLPREAVPSELLTSPEVWGALLEDMPMTAMIRNLATMTRVGLLGRRTQGTRLVVERLRDGERLRRARVHPIAVLAALRTYQAGRGVRGQHTWKPVRAVVDALDDAFYAAFGNVEPTGGRTMLALDVSGSMGWGEIAGVPGLTPRDASAAMTMVTAATERDPMFVGFCDTLVPLKIRSGKRLDRVVKTISGLPFGATDCAQPMLYATAKGLAVDTFVVYTDSETWAGRVTPAEALKQYRAASGIDARLVVVGMVAGRFTIADPLDPGMLDVVGFDTATPQVIADFARRAM
ncbi:MAG TPA: TROVE domain-containing protein [Solirubrobacteraceae bacterium]|nr:TROVE domain-containing protein [Solirubrobacteraceae bacterium]